MKNYINAIFLMIAIISLTTFMNCTPGPDPDPDPDPVEERLKALQNNGNSWTLSGSGVVKDGYNVTDQFAGFSLTVGEYTYSVQNSLSSAWPSSGSWQFNNGNINSLVRNDGVEINVSLSGQNLRLTFGVAGDSGGRISGLAGDYIFNLVSE